MQGCALGPPHSFHACDWGDCLEGERWKEFGVGWCPGAWREGRKQQVMGAKEGLVSPKRGIWEE